MNQKEFTDRTGYTPINEKEWKAIETMYLEAGQTVDKDLFCKEWLEHKDSDLLKVFYRRAMENTTKLENYDTMRTASARLLIEKSEDYDDNDMYWQAVKLIGQKKVVLYKVEKGFSLNDDDRKYIAENLQ